MRSDTPTPESESAPRNNQIVLIAMPYPPGVGYAWRYIEAVVCKLGKLLCQWGVEVHVGFPADLERAGPDYDGLHLVLANFYSQRRVDQLHCRALVRRLRVRTLYYAEHGPYSTSFVGLRLSGIKRIVVHLHHAGGAKGPARGVGRWLREARSLMPMMQADLACCVSQFVARRVIDASVFPEARVRVVLNAVMPTAATKDSTGPELKRAYTAAASGRPLIVCCSRASLEKGLDLLLLAFDRVYREAAALHMPRPFLLYCGGGPDLPLLREMRETLAARDSIVMPGPVTGSHGPLSHAAVAVHYARCEEAFGLFALEAMSAGVPVIVSDRGGLPEVVEASETGLIVPAENAPLLAAAISELLTNAERAHAMGAAGRRRALEVFSMDSMIRTLAAHVIG